MKTITSYGGPFIGLDRKDVARWSGVFGKTSVGTQFPFSSDYEAACALTDRVNLAFDDLGYFSNLSSKAVLIAPPVETAVIACGADLIILAQVEAAEEAWSFEHITDDTIKAAQFNEFRQFSIQDSSAKYILFDSSCEGISVEEYLSVKFKRGVYVALDAMCSQNGLADINLYKFAKVSAD